MASMIQPSHFPTRNTHNEFGMPSRMRNPHPAYVPGLGGSAWSGIPNIWQTTARDRPNQASGILQAVSSTRNDSLTAPESPCDPPVHEPQERVNPGDAYPLRSTNSLVVPAPTSVGRSSHSNNSPPRRRGPGSLSAHTTSNMPHLSTATLLNGSAPDVDLRTDDIYPSSRPTSNRLQTFNVENIDEFVPASQQLPIRSLPPRQRYANEWATSFAAGSVDFNVDSQSFIPGAYMGNAILRQDDVGQSESRSHDNRRPTQRDEWHHQSFGQNPGQVFPPGSDAQTHHLSAAFNNLHMEHLQQQYPYQNTGDAHRQERLLHHNHPDDLSAGDVPSNRFTGASEVITRGFSTPQLPYQSANSNTNGLGADKTGSGFPGMTIYTPSYTPPTAPGSRRSNSGSGASTRASSQSVDTRFASFDAGSGIHSGRQAAFSGHQAHANLAYHTHGLNPYGSMLIPPQGRLVRSYEGQGHHTNSSEARIQHEKEQNLSPLIKDFRANYKTKRYELKDAYNHIVEFSGDQHGSRFIQAKLETANSEEKEKVFAEIQENALQLMTDIFGNYVIQKMFEHGTQAQKKILANQMKGRVYYLTTQVYGCRVVQKALEHILTDQQASMVKELNGNILGIVENQNGNHVIQKAIERVPSEHIQFIFDAHVGHVVRLSKHNYGCRVIQRILEYGPVPVKRTILGELRDAIPNLIEDQFGNYVMQHIIRNGEPADRQMVVDLIQHQLLHYSKHKFASNVVEAAIECAEEQQRGEILQELTTGYDALGHSQVYGLIRDQYGNYVIQKVLGRLRGAALNNLVVEIQHHLVTLRKISHGKQVSAMEKALAEAVATLEQQNGGHTSTLHAINTDARQRSSTFLGAFQQHNRGASASSRTIPPRLHSHV